MKFRKFALCGLSVGGISFSDPVFHPATKILLWLALAIALQSLDFIALTSLSIVMGGLFLAGRNLGAVLRMVRRVRWLLFSLLMIYAFVTPGDMVFPALGVWSPSLQGLHDGALQAWRLVLLVSALGLLLQSCPRENLLSGLYVLMRPFGFLGLNAERVAVRIWLTLEYVEQQPRRTIQGWWDELRSTLDPAPGAATHITLELPAFTWRDAVALALTAPLLGLALW